MPWADGCVPGPFWVLETGGAVDRPVDMASSGQAHDRRGREIGQQGTQRCTVRDVGMDRAVVRVIGCVHGRPGIGRVAQGVKLEIPKCTASSQMPDRGRIDDAT